MTFVLLVLCSKEVAGYAYVSQLDLESKNHGESLSYPISCRICRSTKCNG